jgi:hypothetical protein
MEKGLGRITEPDDRDLNYLMRAARPGVFQVPLDELPQVVNYERGIILDQGQTGTCVEFSLEAKLRGAPNRVGPKRVPPRFSVYDEATQLDEWADNNHDVMREMGTSVRAGCQVLQRLGLITSYHWAFDEDEILRWILGGQGGLVLGLPWLRDMGYPDADGIIRARGDMRGGHAIYAFGADRIKGMVHLQNSWGEEFGGWPVGGTSPLAKRKVFKGCVRLPMEDLRKLVRIDGEAVAIRETVYVPTFGKRPS